MTEHLPEHPGHVKMNITPGQGSLTIDDYDLGQFVSSVRVLFDAKARKPVMLLDLLPSAIDITGTTVEMRGDFRDFLIAHGWRPPE